ncbi:MAG: hypothetical protein V2B14_03315 [bacterium]
MNLSNKWTSDLTGKDKAKAQQAAEHILNTPDTEAWQCLIENTDYLYSYIKEKACKHLINAVNKDNFENIFQLLKYYSEDFDEYIAEILSKFASEELNLKVFELLKSGSLEEKAYSAKYFVFVNYNEISETLFDAAKSDYQPLKNNAAQALGKINDQESYNYFIKKLISDDDWEKLEAAKFLANYNNKEAVLPILNAMSNSGMAEHIAGEAASLADIFNLFKKEETQILAFEAFDNIISGIGDIWNVGVLLNFKIYETVENLIELAKKNSQSPLAGKYAQLLLKTKAKITLFIENSLYTFDEEKHVLNELEEIHHLLLSEDENFWNQQVQNLHKELKTEDIKRKLSAINIINELEIKNLVPYLTELALNSDESEIVLFESILTLIKLGQISQIKDPKALLSRIHDSNLSAILENSLK